VLPLALWRRWLVWSGPLPLSGRPKPEGPVRLAPGKVRQESERPETSPHEPRIDGASHKTPGSTSSPSSENAGSCAAR
jgi:hypothetical protein